MDSNTIATFAISSLIVFLIIPALTGSYLLGGFLVLAFMLHYVNIDNFEIRDDKLLLQTLLYSAGALGIIVLILFSNTKYFYTRQNHTVLALLFLLAVPSALINTATMSVALSN